VRGIAMSLLIYIILICSKKKRYKYFYVILYLSLISKANFTKHF